MGRRLHLLRRAASTALGAAILAALALPGLTAAHPLGNFTINHYAGLRVERDRVILDLVIDQAEVPTFQASRALDTDGDGTVTPAEAHAGRVATCASLLRDMTLTIDGAPRALALTAAGLSFPPGAGGLPTMRAVCVAETAIEPALDPATPMRIAFRDDAFSERIGWREIVVVGSGVDVSTVGSGASPRPASVSARLTAYRDDLLGRPLDDAGIEVMATAGGPILPPWTIPDATPIVAPSGAAPRAGSAAIPGGIEGDLPSIFRSTDLTPLVLLLSLLTAAALGAGHALTPGHGKTLMAAYLVGTRGTVLHAVGLGLSVSLSHTVGILVLAGVVLGAADLVSPDLVVRVAPVVSALSIVAIGGWMLLVEARRRRAARADARAHAHAHEHDLAHDHDHDHVGGHDHPSDPFEHAHGGVRHSHAPARGATVTWRSLFALGLAGGLIPSTSALLILLGAIAAGRPAFGLVLVVAFGLGMAAVMGGIGVALVVARGRLDRVHASGVLGRAGAAVPLVAAIVVFGFGIWLTVGALGSTGIW